MYIKSSNTCQQFWRIQNINKNNISTKYVCSFKLSFYDEIILFSFEILLFLLFKYSLVIVLLFLEQQFSEEKIFIIVYIEKRNNGKKVCEVRFV